MKTILFQGDSVTDAGRSRENDTDMGRGYPTLIAGKLGFEYPNEFRFLNRGISGNRSVDVYARMKADIVNLKPDLMTMLIGINDVWHELSYHNGVSAEKYEKIYQMLVEEVLAELPDLKIYILEPFVLNEAATQEHFGYFQTETRKRAEAAKRIAERNHLTFIPLQEEFEKAAEKVSAEYWLADGVHPSLFGHELIARRLEEAFKTYLK